MLKRKKKFEQKSISSCQISFLSRKKKKSEIIETKKYETQSKVEVETKNDQLTKNSKKSKDFLSSSNSNTQT